MSFVMANMFQKSKVDWLNTFTRTWYIFSKKQIIPKKENNENWRCILIAKTIGDLNAEM